MAFRPSPNFALAVDLNKSLYLDTHDRVYLGMEKGFWGILFPRAGYSQNLAAETNHKYTLGLGIGFRSGARLGFSFDFAYLFSGLRNTPRISTSLLF